MFSIAIYSGDSPFNLVSLKSIDNPVLTREDVTDITAAFVADPFLLKTPDAAYMFFEALNRHTKNGEIALAVSQDGMKWSYKQIVLTETFHLSYPYVFRWGNDYFMTPESYQDNSVRLYRAHDFPTRWTYVTALITGAAFVDPSVLQYNNKWWLFVGVSPDEKNDTLRLYFADDLLGPWKEHPLSPLIDGDARLARPGGRMLVFGDKIFRYAQNCYPLYGSAIRAFEILELTTKTYVEREIAGGPILKGTGSGWNACGMHHIDPLLMDDGRWVACVDGWTNVELASVPGSTS